MDENSKEFLFRMTRKGLEKTISRLADAEMQILTILKLSYNDIDIRERAIEVGYTLAAAIMTVEDAAEYARNYEMTGNPVREETGN